MTDEFTPAPQTLTLEQALARLDEISDRLGLPVDAAIKKPVASLWMNGISTTGSCEGHADRALPYPWIDIETKDPPGWRDDEKIQDRWRKANLAQARKVKKMLDEFYANSPSSQSLILKSRGIFGAHRLQPIGDYGPDQPDLERSRAEMERFAQFLIHRAQTNSAN